MVIIGNSDAYRKFISLARADNSNPAISFDYCQALGLVAHEVLRYFLLSGWSKVSVGDLVMRCE